MLNVERCGQPMAIQPSVLIKNIYRSLLQTHTCSDGVQSYLALADAHACMV